MKKKGEQNILGRSIKNFANIHHPNFFRHNIIIDGGKFSVVSFVRICNRASSSLELKAFGCHEPARIQCASVARAMPRTTLTKSFSNSCRSSSEAWQSRLWSSAHSDTLKPRPLARRVARGRHIGSLRLRDHGTYVD